MVLLLMASFMVRASRSLQVFDRKVTRERLLNFQLWPFHHFRVGNFIRLINVFEHGAIALLLLLTFA